MAAWQEFLRITNKLCRQVDRRVTDSNREDVAVKVQMLLHERGLLMKDLPQPETESELSAARQVYMLNQTIGEKLTV
ncbi:hypothetical protein KWI09_23485 [Enterobacter cloacae]|nr:hypothetical protein [Enterobacter cloacae]MCU6204558.1 hypothetical protein [Enterobacter cloacae]